VGEQLTPVTPRAAAKDFVDDTGIPLGDPPGTIFVEAWGQRVVQGRVPDCGVSDPRTQMIREAYEFYRWEMAREDRPAGRVRGQAVKLLRRAAKELLRVVRGKSAAQRDAGALLDEAANAEWNERLFEEHAEYRPDGPDGPHLFVGQKSANRLRNDAGRVAAFLDRAADDGENPWSRKDRRRHAGGRRRHAGGRWRHAAERAFVDGLLRPREDGTRLAVTAKNIAQLWIASDIRNKVTEDADARLDHAHYLGPLVGKIESIIARLSDDYRLLLAPVTTDGQTAPKMPSKLRRTKSASGRSRLVGRGRRN
jgi:hypothetical protein